MSPKPRLLRDVERTYTAQQEVALDGLARILAAVLKRRLERQRPDLRRRVIKSSKP